MSHVAGLERALASGLFGDLDLGSVEAILAEAGKFARDVLAPASRIGDTHGATLSDGIVTTAPGWRDLYRRWMEGGWSGVVGPAEFGGMGLPHLVHAACMEMWNSTNIGFALCPLLTSGAVEALAAHASEELKQTYLAKLVSGEWSGTMNLTEPHAGSDVGALRTRAMPADDGTYRITGEKIFISYGEHDLTENIIHLVLARLPDAPPGTRGISLFLVPKILPGADGRPGVRNDLRCAGLEHKMGLHASPTCTMVYGEKGGAVGWLVGEANRGLNCMFTMMNSARLAVGLEGVGLAEAATQLAAAYAKERRQGRAVGAAGQGPSLIGEHPDVRRMILTMRALTQAARSICHLTAQAIDRSHREKDADARRMAHERASLLTPIAKAFSTDIASEVAYLGVQVHGGAGFIETTGAAQFMRDARITSIYEGTNGIQAIDLVQRKLGLAGGETFGREMADMRGVLEDLRRANAEVFGATAPRLTAALDALDQCTRYLAAELVAHPDAALAGATPYLRLFGLARGGTALAQAALAAHRQRAGGDADQALAGRIAIARFFAEHIAVAAPALAEEILHGAASVNGDEAVLAL
jgi:alkylation response protein AidB-like acyl-CoA dehydrogenase